MSKTILLADDSVTIQKVIELTFLDQDYEVEAVSTGDEALSKLDSVDPDLVIADVHMPGADGYEVARRSKERDPTVPVLLLVGTFEPFDEEELADSGADSHLKKPFDSQELLQLVERLLEAAEAARPARTDTAAEATAEPSGPQAVPEPPKPSEFGAESTAEGDAESAAEAAPRAGTGFPAGKEQLQEEAEVQVVDIGTDEGEEVTWGNLDLDTPQEEVAPTAVEEPEDAVPFSLGEDELEERPVEAARPEPDAAPFRLEEPEEVDLGAGPALEQSTPPEQPPGETPSASETTEEAAVPGLESSAPMAAEGVAPEPREEPAAEQPEAEERAAATAATGLSEEDVERIARRVAELLGRGAIQEVAWEVVPDLAEVFIKDRIRQLESQVE